MSARRTRRPTRRRPVDTPPLSDDDRAALTAALADVTPLPPDDHAWIEPDRPHPVPVSSRRDEADALREAASGKFGLDDWLELGDEPSFLRHGVPKQVLRDLRRGRWVVADELDLHGLTRDLAREWVAQFLADSLKAHHRCLRIIHGKGLGSPHGVPVLKALVKSWLARHDAVLAYCPARPVDGGDGALLVLLRGRAR